MLSLPVKTLFLLGLLFLSILASPDLSSERGPIEGSRLKIKLDYGFATRTNSQSASDHTWLVSSHLTFKGPVSKITDGQLVQMAIDAAREIDPQLYPYLPSNRDKRGNLPGAMGIFAFGNEIILLSSFKGGVNFIDTFPDSKMSLLLQQCTATFQQGRGPDAEELEPPGGQNLHKNAGHCAEIMAFHMYARRYPEQPLRLRTDKPRAVTVSKMRGEVIPPCGDAGQPGCNWVVAQEGVTYLDTTTPEDYDLEALGLESIGQLRACD